MYPSMRRCFGGRYPRSAQRTSFGAAACPGGTLYSEWNRRSSVVTRCRSALFCAAARAALMASVARARSPDGTLAP